jgi:hypothetical protein
METSKNNLCLVKFVLQKIDDTNNDRELIELQDLAQSSELIHNVSNRIDQEQNDSQSKNIKNKFQISPEEIHNELDSLNLSDIKNKNDVTIDLKDLEFDAPFNIEEVFATNKFDYSVLRKRAHVQTVAAVSHAAYFVAIANKIRRNFFDIKNGFIKQKNSLLLNEIDKEPGLRVGIIGAGKLGQLLAKSVLEYSNVHPNELRISTRQPDLLPSENLKYF